MFETSDTEKKQPTQESLPHSDSQIQTQESLRHSDTHIQTQESLSTFRHTHTDTDTREPPTFRLTETQVFNTRKLHLCVVEDWLLTTYGYEVKL